MPVPDLPREYLENGYLIVRAAASAGTARLLKDEVLRILDEDARSKAGDTRYQGANAHVRFTTGLHLRSPAILDHVRSAALCGTARALLGPSAELQFTSTITKSPGKNQEVDWHQDAVFEKDGGKDGPTWSMAVRRTGPEMIAWR